MELVRNTSKLLERQDKELNCRTQRKMKPILAIFSLDIRSTQINALEFLKHLKKYKPWYGAKSIKVAKHHKIRASISS